MKDQLIREIFANTRSIAVIGLSPDSDKASNRVAKFLQAKGYKIIPVYPKEELILGEKVYRSLSEIDGKVDMVVMFRKAEFAAELLEQIQKRGDVKTLWLQLGLTNRTVIDKARSLGLNAIQDKCAMIEYERLEIK